MTTLHIIQEGRTGTTHSVTLRLERAAHPPLTAKAHVEFALTAQEQADLTWYMEDYLQQADAVEPVQVEQIEAFMRQRGEELYRKVLDADGNTRAIWFAIREQLAELRIQITTGIAEAASIPWELMCDPTSGSAIALRVRAFVRVQSDPNISFIPAPGAEDGRVRLLYVVCRPGGGDDVGLRAVANRLLQVLGEDRSRFEFTALRPPTFERLQEVLRDAKAAGRPYHIVHFDGHGMYEDLSKTEWGAAWLKAINAAMFGGAGKGKHGYLLFEDPKSGQNMRPVAGGELGKLLHDTGVPVLVLNACQSAMHEATEQQEGARADVHDQVRAIGSLAQAVVDQGIPAVLGMRYSVYVVTAAQYIGELYGALAKGRTFGEAASEGRKHLALNPDRWVGLEPRPLQDWCVPVVYEAAPVGLLRPQQAPGLELGRPELDPAQTDPALRRHVPETGFVGRDETLLLLDRAFDHHPIVLLHAYAGQGKSSTAVEFARWYAQTGGLGPQPIVLFTSFEHHTDLEDVLNRLGQAFAPALQQNGIEWHALNDMTQRRQLALEILKQVPMLWIWDNVEPVAGFPEGTPSAWTTEEQTELADFLKQIKITPGTKARILLTSRRDEEHWLGGIPHRIAMPRMGRTDAAALARTLGSERKIGPNEIADWEPLLAYCQGNPLTLRVLVGQAIKQGVRGRQAVEGFVEAIRTGEQAMEDTDADQGRDRSLGASLNYGFKHAFTEEELPIIALLHLFQGTVDVDVLLTMGSDSDEAALPALVGKTKEDLTSILTRAEEAGLLTHLFSTWSSIHPALPWFLHHLFEQHYDGAPGRPSAEAAIKAWVASIAGLGSFYHNRFGEGVRDVIPLLILEENNLLQGRTIARRSGWWRPMIACMQGIRVLYEYQGRITEWARLVVEVTPHLCDPQDDPVSGREADYNLIMNYRVRLALRHDLDLAEAARLQSKLVDWSKAHIPTGLTPANYAMLGREERSKIREYGVIIFTLGQILAKQKNVNCIAAYEESIELDQLAKDTEAEATVHFNLGHAYRNIPGIIDLDAAETSYQRSLELRDPKDDFGCSLCIKEIGSVHYRRFLASRDRNDPKEVLVKHAQAAEQHLLKALHLCPANALASLAPMHNELGVLYANVGLTELAREHYEKSIRYEEHTGNRDGAGQTRFNIANMYLRMAASEENPILQRDLLERAQAYAQAALRDFQHYQGRVADQEGTVQKLLEILDEALAQLAVRR